MGYRIFLTLSDYPSLGGDESVIGIMAVHIADGTDLPAFFYRQHYMGSLQAFLAVPFVQTLGTSALALRIGTLLMYAGFFWATFWTARRLVSPWFAVLTVGVLAFGSDRVIRQQLQANGGWQELLLFGAVLAAVTMWICLNSSRRDVWAYGLWGLLAGMALWANVMIAPSMAAFAVMVLAFQWRRVWGRRAVALLAGVLAGLLPAILHNLHLPLGSGTLASVFAYNPGGSETVTLVDHLRGTAYGLSLATGMCELTCQPWQVRWWAAAYVTLLAISAVAACLGIRRALRSGSRLDQVRYATLLALVFGAVGTLGLFLQSIHSGLGVGYIWHNSRYLNNLLLAAPAVLWPLWAALAGRVAGAARWALRVATAGVLAAILASAGSATAFTVTDGVAAEHTAQQQHEELLAQLDTLGVQRLYTDYFTCHKLIFATRERILCASIDAGLARGYDRWRPYRPVVAAEPLPYYVFATGTWLDVEFQRYLAEHDVPVQKSSTSA